MMVPPATHEGKRRGLAEDRRRCLPQLSGVTPSTSNLLRCCNSDVPARRRLAAEARRLARTTRGCTDSAPTASSASAPARKSGIRDPGEFIDLRRTGGRSASPRRCLGMKNAHGSRKAIRADYAWRCTEEQISAQVRSVMPLSRAAGRDHGSAPSSTRAPPCRRWRTSSTRRSRCSTTASSGSSTTWATMRAMVQAARVSYGSGTKRVSEDTASSSYLMRHRHTTPFEMCEIKYHVKLPIFVARQWIRHRTANVNEYSRALFDPRQRVLYPGARAARGTGRRPTARAAATCSKAPKPQRVLDLLREDAERAYRGYAEHAERRRGRQRRRSRRAQASRASSRA